MANSAGGGGVRIIESDSRFRSEITNARDKRIIVSFTASWCGACQQVAPKFQELSMKYKSAIFLEVDIDACKETSNRYVVASVPTFMLFRASVKLEEMKGSDLKALEDKIKNWAEDYEEEEEGNVPKGYADLSPFINKSHCECLNESDDHMLSNAFQKGASLFLESDCDEQLLISVSFHQPVKLHSLKLHAPDDGKAPKNVKIFTNQLRTMGFDEAERETAVQALTLTSDDVTEDALISLRFVKFQYVRSITLFVNDNQGGEETTIINKLTFVGLPVEATDMSAFKRVSGKEGEGYSM